MYLMSPQLEWTAVTSCPGLGCAQHAPFLRQHTVFTARAAGNTAATALLQGTEDTDEKPGVPIRSLLCGPFLVAYQGCTGCVARILVFLLRRH